MSYMAILRYGSKQERNIAVLVKPRKFAGQDSSTSS